MEQQNNQVAEIDDSMAHLKHQVSFIVDSVDSIAQPKTSGDSKEQRDGGQARANSKPEWAAKRVPVSERLVHQAPQVQTRPPWKNINERLKFQQQEKSEARSEKGLEAGHQHRSKINNISTHNCFEVLAMRDRGPAVEFTVTFRNMPQNPDIADLQTKVTKQLGDASSGAGFRLEKLHFVSDNTAYLRVRVSAEESHGVTNKGRAELAGESGEKRPSIAWRRWLPKAGTRPAKQMLVRVSCEQGA